MAYDPTVRTLAPGIHRIEIVEDEKLHGYHLIEGTSGLIILDPGFTTAPTEVYAPILEREGWDWADVTMALVTHSDADHHGGIADLRSHNPSVAVAAHTADIPLMESVDRIMTERYGMFEEEHGIAYGDDVRDWLTGMMGPDDRVDLHLRGGERLSLDDRELSVLHTPGHTAGHLALFDAENDVLLGGDAFFGRGLFDVEGTYLQPPPYYLYPGYRNTVQLVESLDADLISFTHYEVLEGDDIDEFITESLDFVTEIEELARTILDERGTVTLQEAIDQVVDRRGSFGLNLDLAFPLSAHFDHLVETGDVERSQVDGRVAWTVEGV